MPKEYSININDFTGIHKAMAEKANVNGGKTLDNIEISIFNEILSTYNQKDNTFIIENTIYDKNGKKIDNIPLKIAERVSTRISLQKPIEDFEKDIKNLQTIEEAKKAAKEIEQIKNKPLKGVKYVNGKKTPFTYKRSTLENYIIEYTKKLGDSAGVSFAEIPNIRKKGIAFRTKEESRLLLEFNNLVNGVINASSDYEVDPRLVLAFIQKEVKFDGTSKNAIGNSGKGYMQLTSVVIEDMLGKIENGYQKGLKTSIYGKEITELFKSKNFNVDCPPEKRGHVAKKIIDYLKANKDSDLNIRIGTLLIRRHMKTAKGNIEKAGKLYNTVYDSYGKSIKNIYDKICKYFDNYTTT